MADQLDHRLPNFSVLADWGSVHDSPHVSPAAPLRPENINIISVRLDLEGKLHIKATFLKQQVWNVLKKF